jgi:hypothetical protein
MKKIILIFTGVLLLFNLNGQTDELTASDSPPQVFLGTGTGLSSYNGLLGISTTFALNNRIAFRGGAGLGAWGFKLTGGLKFHKNSLRGWSYGLSYSHYTGIKNMKLVMELGSGDQEEITFDYLPTGSVNLTMAYSWKVGRKNNFYLEYGYAIATDSKPWKIKDGSVLSSTSETVMNIVRPGGVILSAGFNFGLK